MRIIFFLDVAGFLEYRPSQSGAARWAPLDFLVARYTWGRLEGRSLRGPAYQGDALAGWLLLFVSSGHVGAPVSWPKPSKAFFFHFVFCDTSENCKGGALDLELWRVEEKGGGGAGVGLFPGSVSSSARCLRIPSA